MDTDDWRRGEVMAGREKLPGRRFTCRTRFESAGIRFHADIGFYPDGRPGEVFLTAGKVGGSVETLCRDAAIVLSFALQYGANWRAIRAAICRDEAGAPLGPIGVLLDRLEYDLEALAKEEGHV